MVALTSAAALALVLFLTLSANTGDDSEAALRSDNIDTATLPCGEPWLVADANGDVKREPSCGGIWDASSWHHCAAISDDGVAVADASNESSAAASDVTAWMAERATDIDVGRQQHGVIPLAEQPGIPPLRIVQTLRASDATASGAARSRRGPSRGVCSREQRARALVAASSFPEFRYILSGRRTASPPPALQELLTAYAALHRDIIAGRRPLRLLVSGRCDPAQLGPCGGFGDRTKSLRLLFYTAVMTSRAILFPRWGPSFALDDTFDVNSVDWRVPPHLADVVEKEGVHCSGRNSMWPYLQLLFDVATGPDRVVVANLPAWELDFVAQQAMHRRCSDEQLQRLWVPQDPDTNTGGIGNATLPVSESTVPLWTLMRVSDSDTRTTACISPRVIDALFWTSLPVPEGVMLDFLFRPNASFVTEHIVPLVDALPLWNSDVPRIGVHVRTGAADGGYVTPPRAVRCCLCLPQY